MQITVQQYNSVVTGLKTQLELLRAQVTEKIDTIHKLVDQLGAARKTSALNQETIKLVIDQRNAFQEKLAACGRAAIGLMDVTEETHSPEYEKVASLRRAYEAKLERPRKRK